MNDSVRPSDTPSEQLEAVSAIIDGTATDDQRALVDASPDLVQLLDELRSNRRAVAAVDVPAALRDTHLAAALAAFDELHDPAGPAAAAAAAAAGAGAGAHSTATGTSSNVVSLDRRRRLYRPMMGAAAAVVLVIAGVAALGSLGGGSDDDSASLATASSKAGSDAAVSAEAPAADAAVAATDSPADDASAEALAPLSVEASTARTEAGTDSGDTAAPAETTAAAEPTRPTIGSIGPGGAQAAPPIANEQQLADYVATATLDGDAAPDDALCVPAGDENLGTISYQGTLAVVVRDTRSDQITVYATEGCESLVTVPG